MVEMLAGMFAVRSCVQTAHTRTRLKNALDYPTVRGDGDEVIPLRVPGHDQMSGLLAGHSVIVLNLTRKAPVLVLTGGCIVRDGARSVRSQRWLSVW